MINLLYIDLFCGAGGTSTGVELSRVNGEQCAKVIACVNHDKNAIASHAANHPDALHFTEDIRTLDLTELIAYTFQKRKEYPNAKLILWASLECTNFSKAKGGLPRDADSRTLAHHLYRYIDALNPDYIQIENVVEFMSWGPLDKNGKPISRRNGEDWLAWKNHINATYGYRDEWKELNSANYGAYTSRNRLFGIFAKDNLHIVWPEPTHAKNAKSGTLFDSNLKRWKPVKEVLNLEDEGESIFTRTKPLSERTYERIYAGLVKFVAKGDTSFLSKYYSGHPESKNISVDEPAHSVTGIDHHSLIKAFVLKYNSNDQHGNTSPNCCTDIEEPAHVVAAQARMNLVQSKFIQTYYGNGGVHSLENPAPVVTTVDRQAVVSTKHFIDRDFKSITNSSVDESAGTLTTVPKMNLVSYDKWIMNTNFNNVGNSLDNPSPTITADRHHYYLMNPQYTSAGGDIENPCFTLIARMDKMPPYLMVAKEGNAVAIAVFNTDSEIAVKIKQFMAAYGIVDIKMRMLRIPELKQIMGFPKEYVLIGTQAEQKKYIGNAVEVNMAKAMCKSLAKALLATA